MKELKQLAKDYFEQDNYGTRYPIYFVIRDVEWQPSYHFEDGDRYVAIFDTEQIGAESNLRDLFNNIKDDCDFIVFPEDFDINLEYDWNAEELCQANDNLLSIFSEKQEWKESNKTR